MSAASHLEATSNEYPHHMPAISASAPGKIILLGEHAVVYGQPAIAVPVLQVRAKAIVKANPRGSVGQVRVQAPAIGLETDLADLPPKDPIAAAIHAVLAELNSPHPPACTLRITSTISIAAGLGSGAAVSVAIIRALAGFLGSPLPTARISELAYEVEKIHHGTPSGIDNTVVTYEKPVYFVRGQPIEPLEVGKPLTFVIADTGITSPTAETVGDVRRAWQSYPDRIEPIFVTIGKIVQQARRVIKAGESQELGALMLENHGLLRALGVSSQALDRLVEAAQTAGSLGAKLSGGGRGGNIIALVPADAAKHVRKALQDAGATTTLITTVGERESA